MAKGLEDGLAEGHARGLEEGLAEGLAKGLKEGFERGEAEGRAKAEAEFADKLLALGEKGAIANARHWGARSDKVKPKDISLFNDAEAAADDDAEEPESVPEGEVRAPAKKPHNRGRRKAGARAASIKGLPVVVIEHELEGDAALCPVCNGTLDEFKVDITDRVRYTPAHLEVERHRQHVGICPVCSKANAAGEDTPAVIVRAEIPKPLLKGSYATPSLVAGIIVEKHVMSSPLYRIEQDFKRKGLYLPRSVTASWMVKAASVWLAPLSDRLAGLMLTRDVLHCDETKVFVLKEPDRAPGSLSYMWVWATPKCDKEAIVVFKYHPSRAADVPKGFLEGWKGYLMTDGYSAYHGFGADITVVGCMAHVRRKFTDIIKGLGQEAPPGAVSVRAVEMIDEMFSIERELKAMAPDERKKAREMSLRPKMEAFFAWVDIEAAQALPKHALARALGYAQNQREYVMNVFKDGRLEISNNRAENQIRPFAVFRRNCLFSDTPKGAHGSATLFSLIQTAQANGLKPFEYLKWVLEGLPFEDDRAEPATVDKYLPWAEGIPDSCRMPEGRPEEPPKEPVLLPPDVDIEEIESAIRLSEELVAEIIDP